MPTRISQVDAFTNRAFAGNPAAVCVLTEPADVSWMQAVAAEMNLSETAFLHPEGNGYRLRWFTPVAEVPLCGHATLASAHILWEDGHLQPEQTACFETSSGPLLARRTPDGIELDFPIRPVELVDPPEVLTTEFGHAAVSFHADSTKNLIELADERAVRSISPDTTRLAGLTKGVIVTARSDEPAYDFVSRYFAAHVGIPEDPVTGSAHCCLAPYWRDKLGKDTFNAYQASKRGGSLGVRIAGERVILTGQAVTVLKGDLLA